MKFLLFYSNLLEKKTKGRVGRGRGRGRGKGEGEGGGGGWGVGGEEKGCGPSTRVEDLDI